jgi:hypothetical protein
LAAEISAINAADFGRVGVTQDPDNTRTDFPLSSDLEVGSEFVYLNGLLQEEVGDYTTTIVNDEITNIVFNTAPKVGYKIAVAGNIIK